MTRCPNCGSAIRIGAKFCTSCGFRLTVDEPVTASPVAPSRSPFSTTSTPAWSAGPAETTASAETTAVTDEDDVEPAWAKVDEGDEGLDEDDVVDEGLASGDAVAATVGDEVAERTTEDEQPESTWFSPPGQDTSGPVSDDMVAALGGDHADQLRADIASETDDDAPVALIDTSAPEALRTTYTWSADDQQITAVRDTSVAEPPSGGRTETVTAPITGDPLAEARSLVVRLSDLLTAVRSGAGTGASAKTAPTSVADESDVEVLRSIVTSAQERPRDVDVMLDLVLRADTIAAVLADRDLLLAALRGDESAVEETWAPGDDEPSTYPAWRALP